MNKVYRFFWCGCVAFILTGCSTVVNSHLQKEGMMTAYRNGGNAVVDEELKYKLRAPHWYNTSVVNSGDEIMWRLEAGSFNFHRGNFPEAIEQFKTAERLIAEYDERARISARDIGAEAGTALTNLNTLPYRGFCRDRLALAFYKSLAYLGEDNESAFRAQIRRLRNEQKKVQEDYKEFFEAEQAEIKAAEAKNPEAARKAAEKGGSTQIFQQESNAELRDGLAEVNKIAHKGYGHFLNPATIFLSGLGSILDDNYDNARIDFKRLYEAMPDNRILQKYYVTVLQKAERPVPEKLKNVKPFDFSLKKGCVYVIVANGRSAAFKQIAVYYPIMTAWPMLEFYPMPFQSALVQGGGRKTASTVLADMNGIIAQEFKERLPGIITRIVLSTLIKEAAYHASLAAIDNSNMTPLIKWIVWGSVVLGGTSYRAAMNTADTRSWEMLPGEFQLAQLPLPKDRQVNIRLQGAGDVSRTVMIPADCSSAVVFVSAPGRDNVSCHVLPIKSR